MYEKYYRLKKSPFENTPDPDFLFLSKNHREVLASLRYAVNEAKGFVLVTGDIGTGKTTLIQALIKQLDRSFIVVSITNPRATFDEILRHFGKRLGIPDRKAGILETFEAIQHRLELLHERVGKHAVLIIDEAHLLSDKALENIRLISNIENQRRKLVQIILVGQNELNIKLQKDSLRPLKQRLVVTRRLLPLSRAETTQYILHRLSVAGRRSQIFEKNALTLIWRKSKGIPRVINQLCDNSLLIGYAIGSNSISAKIVREVIQDKEVSDRNKWRNVASIRSIIWIIVLLIPVALFTTYTAVKLNLWNNSEITQTDVVKDLNQAKTPVSGHLKDSSLITRSESPKDALPTENLEKYSDNPRDHDSPGQSHVSAFGWMERANSVEESHSAPTEQENIHQQDDFLEASLIETNTTLSQTQHGGPNSTIALDAQKSRETGVISWALEEHFPGEKKRGSGKQASSSTSLLSEELDSTQPTKTKTLSARHLIGEETASNRIRVKPDDCLLNLALKRYGVENTRILRLIQMANPAISDVNKIYPGQEIIFPKIENIEPILTDKYDIYHIYYATFYREIAAKECMYNLIKNGQDALMISSETNSNKIYRVYVGKFENEQDAKTTSKSVYQLNQ